MMTHPAAPSPRPDRLPPGVAPGPFTLPPGPPRGPVTPSPALAGWPAGRRPKDIIADLAAQLRALGVAARMYAAAGPDRAVLSLPQLTVWATRRSLYWTHHGQPVTWPAGDAIAAARHIAQLTRPSPPQTTPLAS
jgi:hypothetical protein